MHMAHKFLVDHLICGAVLQAGLFEVYEYSVAGKFAYRIGRYLTRHFDDPPTMRGMVSQLFISLISVIFLEQALVRTSVIGLAPCMLKIHDFRYYLRRYRSEEWS